MLPMISQTSHSLFLAFSISVPLAVSSSTQFLSVCLCTTVYLALPPTLSDTGNYSCVTEMSSAGVGEERIDNDYTWPLPWQLFQLMCAPVRSAGLQGREGGKRNTNIWSHVCHMKWIWAGSERGGGRDKGVFCNTWQQHPICLRSCIVISGASLFKMLPSISKQIYTLSCFCGSQPCTESFMQRKGGGGGVCEV